MSKDKLTPEEIIADLEKQLSDAFFNKDNSHIAKNEYGIILIKTLCQKLREKFISPITDNNK